MRAGLPTPVYWLLVVLFPIAAASVYWGRLYIRDVWIGEHLLVADRFDRAASLRITTACFASLSLTSEVLFAYYKRADTYGSPWELFFGMVFALSFMMAVIGLLPSLA
jgi:hypothetical protein